MNTLIPQYMNKFQCIGSKCEDTCCSGWKVIVDEKTYRKYRKTNNPILKTDFQKKITRQRSDKSSKNFAKIKMKENGDCSFLTDEKLCGIQLNLGEDYLSDTCSVYPRIINAVDNSIEKSASLSCPEAARVALLDSRKMEFETKIEDSRSNYIVKKIMTQKSSTDEIQLYFWDIRIFSINLMQNRDFSIEDRLIMLGIFCNSLKNIVTQKKYVKIPNLISDFSIHINNNEFKKIFEIREKNTKIKLALCEELIEYKVDLGIRNKRYLECLNEINDALLIEDVISKEEKYNKAYNDYYTPFMEDNEYILENYVVNYLFKSLFPSDSMNVFDSYIMLTVHFSLIKYHLIGLSGFHKKLNEDLIIKLIQSYSKVVEHNYLYLSKVLNLVKENKMNNIAYMTILIKN
ncbi:flagellin lysine-N-methylase [Exiguobacterium sp. s95]|uniref:flagellin lysine-N-methylase n=1 Tax=Exiguobacterium sp. s95 TaxID=2751211 RepID=UPI001BE6F50F|nr:flagellin lysine-N-methylase [Exiguobacterium sp. s95]